MQSVSPAPRANYFLHARRRAPAVCLDMPLALQRAQGTAADSGQMIFFEFINSSTLDLRFLIYCIVIDACKSKQGL